jgi:hypothetical protein
LEWLLRVLDPRGTDRAADLAAGWTLHSLGRFRQPLADYLDHALTFGRSRRQLLYLAVLLHDVGKATTFARGSEGDIRFLGHEAVGAAMAVQAARRLALSLTEIAELERLVADHMRPGWLEKEGPPSRRAVYRYYRSTQAAGVGIELLSLADLLGKQVPPVPEEAWSKRLTTVEALMVAWFEARRERVDPQPLVDGEAVMRIAGIPPGPIVGRLLDEVREAQAAGEVTTEEEAAALLRSRRAEPNSSPENG